MTKDEALKLALETLENNRYIIESEINPPEALEEFDVAITVLRQALEQPDMGIDRGAWDDVPDATKWVDELRGDDVEESQNSTTDVVEPVVWVNAENLQGLTLGYFGCAEIYTDETQGRIRLYTAPPKREWIGLTDEELRQAYGEVSGNEWCLGGISNAETFYDVIEAKLKAKNGF